MTANNLAFGIFRRLREGPSTDAEPSGPMLNSNMVTVCLMVINHPSVISVGAGLVKS